MAHNTNVTNVQPPWGGYPKFIQNGYNDHHLGLWLQQSGYNTYYSGKLFNGHTTSNYNKPLMSGYTESQFFLEPYAYEYFNVTVTRNGRAPENHKGFYSTDLIAQTAQEFLDSALKTPEKPFFMALAPVAPHAWLQEVPVTKSGPPLVAERHRGLFKDYKIPRNKNFNPDQPSSVNWISRLPKLNSTVLEWNDEYQRLRMRSLLAVDEMVGNVVRRLESEGVLDNTYIFYTSDNGFHISQHRLHPGKMCGLETDIRVHLIARGPGIPAGKIRSAPSTHTDLAPTIMKLAGNKIDDKNFDGTPIELGIANEAKSARSEHVAIEFWGIGLLESPYANPGTNVNNTYKGVRIEADEYAFYYSVWCNREREIYDMKGDQGQLINLLSNVHRDKANAFRLYGQPLQAVADRLDALMMVLKSCKEKTCIDPWGALHPEGDVRSLEGALDTKYDAFYRGQTKVQFQRCVGGYLVDAEGPMEYEVFLSGLAGAPYDADWSLRI
jgi:N-acetylglucosamine-6-sulfatase